MGRIRTFRHLVEKYAGDVPYRAVLDELREMGAVKISSQFVEIRKAQITQKKDFTFLCPVSAPLGDALQIVSGPISRTAPLIQRLNVPVATEVELAIVKNRCVERATSMIDGLRNSIAEGVMLPKSRRNAAAHSFTVTILLAERHAEKPRRTRSRRY